MGAFTPNTSSVESSLRESVLDIRDQNSRFKRDNIRYKQKIALDKLQVKMTDAIVNSETALAGINAASSSPAILVETAEKINETYLDLCDARSHLQSLR